MADGWYWLRWPEAVNTILMENAIPLEEIIESTNQVKAESMVVSMDQPRPDKLASGHFWQKFRFSGKFYVQDLRVLAFPFDVLSLSIILEPRSEMLSCYPGNQYGCISLILDPNSTGSTLGSYIGLNGYDIIGIEAREYLR